MPIQWSVVNSLMAPPGISFTAEGDRTSLRER